MNNNSRNSSEHSRQLAVGSRQPVLLIRLLSAFCFLLTGTTGCESLQKKFTRKPKNPTRPSPIIAFQDYTRAMTPLDRYRKHYLLFDYWNEQLLDVLQEGDRANPKRIQRTSGESLSELETLQGLLQDGVAAQAGPWVEERRKVHRQLDAGFYTPSQLNAVRRTLELQTRQFRRQFYWRHVEDQLKEPSASDAEPD